jgi:hypothetical protein
MIPVHIVPFMSDLLSLCVCGGAGLGLWEATALVKAVPQSCGAGHSRRIEPSRLYDDGHGRVANIQK